MNDNLGGSICCYTSPFLATQLLLVEWSATTMYVTMRPPHPPCCHIAITNISCYKWEQGEIPERHARFLGLGPDTDFADRPALSARAGDANAEGSSLRGDRGSDGALTDGRFMTYWSEKGTDRPVRWVFFDGAEFEASTTARGSFFDRGQLKRGALCYMLYEMCPKGVDAFRF